MSLFVSTFLTVALAAPGVVAPKVAPPDVQTAVAQLKVTTPSARIIWRDQQIQLITGLKVPTAGDTPLARVHSFLRAYPIIARPETLQLKQVQVRGGRTVVQLGQRYKDRPVVDHGLVITLDAQGAVTAITNETSALLTVGEATIDEARALELAAEAVDVGTPMSARAVVFARGDTGVAGFEVQAGLSLVRVDAHEGVVMGVQRRWVR